MVKEENIVTRAQYMVLILIGAILVTLCCVEVMRGEDPRSANKEALVSDLTKLGLRAQSYYHTPYSAGGGEGTFIGLNLASLTMRSTNGNGTFSLTSVAAQQIVLHAVGTQLGTNGSAISIDMVVLPDSTSLIFNN